MHNLDYTKIISPHSSHKCQDICETKWSFAEIYIFQSVWLRLRTQMCYLTGIQILDFWFLNRPYPVPAPSDHWAIVDLWFLNRIYPVPAPQDQWAIVDLGFFNRTYPVPALLVHWAIVICNLRFVTGSDQFGSPRKKTNCGHQK